MVLSVEQLEELVVYCSFSPAGLTSWLAAAQQSLTSLELRMDSLGEHESPLDGVSKTDCINLAKNLNSLKLWGALMTESPKWDGFEKLQTLEIVGARFEDDSLSSALQACPNLTNLLLLGCDGVRSVSIELPLLEQCKLDFYGDGNCSLSVLSSKLRSLEVQGCGWIRVPETQCLASLSISNSAGRVYKVDFGKLSSLEFLSIRGIQWCWDAISKTLQLATEVKHLFMKVEFTGDYETLHPFPAINFVDFFNSHQKLEKFDIHGAMFAALCQRNSLKNVDSSFEIPCLTEVVITVRSPLNAEQKMCTLESLVKYGRRLESMVIKILQMKSNHSSADDFFEEICKFSHLHRKIVRIE
uniref:F-box protein n=1 Tax=Kalanchoe fedtschenkoi TaxID=63787 RepID=A0A7N0TX17_KALFE